MSDGLEDLPAPALMALGVVPALTIVAAASFVLGEMTSQSRPSTITVASKDTLDGVTMVATTSDSAPAPRTYIISTSQMRGHFRRAVDVTRVLEPGCTYRIQSYQTGSPVPFAPSRIWNIESAVHVATPACPTNGTRPSRTRGV